MIGSIVEYLFAPDDPEAAIEKMAAPATRIVSLTVTEGGYYLDAVTGEFNASDESIMADLRGMERNSDLFVALDAVRRGWRGAVLQVAAKYTEEEAERIMRLVEAFMRSLAAHCDEAGDPAASHQATD